MVGELLQHVLFDQPGIGELSRRQLAASNQAAHRFGVNVEALGCLTDRHVIFETVAHAQILWG